MKNIAKILIPAIAITFGSCNRNKIPEELIRTAPEKADTLRAINGSKVLVIPNYSGGFDFYRDTNNDGYADTKGTGFYMLGISEIFDENSINSKLNIDSLYDKEIKK